MSTNKIRQVLPSEERTETSTSQDFRNARHRGVRLHIDVTEVEATPSVTVSLQGKDQLTDEYVTIATAAAVTATGHTTLLVYPGIGDRAFDDDAPIAGRKDDVLPAYWRVLATHADSDAITYSVSAELLV